MASVFMAALFAHFTATGAGPVPVSPAPQDVRCYRLMADLADDDDPRLRTAGMTGAQYFLGRIDAQAPGFDLDALTPVDAAEREPLLRECSTLMGTGGRDFRAAGERLAHRRGTI